MYIINSFQLKALPTLCVCQRTVEYLITTPIDLEQAILNTNAPVHKALILLHMREVIGPDKQTFGAFIPSV